MQHEHKPQNQPLLSIHSAVQKQLKAIKVRQQSRVE